MDLLDSYIKVQLLYDESFKVVCVANVVAEVGIKPVPPEINDKTVLMRLGSRSDVMKKELISRVDSGDFGQSNGVTVLPESQKLIKEYVTTYKSSIMDWKTDQIIDNFDRLVAEKGYKPNNAMYYIPKIQFIDLLLQCRSVDHQKEDLLARRKKLIATTYRQLPEISDPKMVETICSAFQIDEATLNTKVKTLQTKVSKADVVAYIHSMASLKNAYGPDDFETEQKWNKWLEKVTKQNNELEGVFGGQGDKSTGNPLVPSDMDGAVRELAVMAQKGNSKFFETYIRCLQVWQVDPFNMTVQALETAGGDDPATINKALSLSYLAMPVQVTFNDWPVRSKRLFLEESAKLYDSGCQDSVLDAIKHIFDAPSAAAESLDFVKQVHMDSVALPERQNVDTAIHDVLANRLTSHLSEAGIKDGVPLMFDGINTLLAKVVNDFNILSNWKATNKDVNTTFGVYDQAVRLIAEPATDYVRKFVGDIKSQEEGEEGSDSLVAEGENRKNFSTMVELLSSLQSLCNISFDYQELLFSDFLVVVKSWSKELVSKVKLALEQDKGLERMPECSYSSSVPNLMGICNAYIKLLDSFKWKDAFQKAILLTELYKGISNALLYYSDSMFAIMQKQLNGSDYGEACTPLNNITKILHYLKDFETPELAESSKLLLDNGGAEVLGPPRKFLSLLIKDAENVEDSAGDPVTLSVRISGLIQNHTRFISKEYNPDWQEEFEGPLSKPLKGGEYIRFDMINKNSSEYAMVIYKFDKLSSVMPIEEKLSLQPKSGALNISINIDTETNDPLFHLRKVGSEIAKTKDRELRQLLDSFSEPVKDIFSREHLDESLKAAPASSKDTDYRQLHDEMVDNYVNDMQLHTIDALYNNLETEMFDQLMLLFWHKVLDAAENLLLPRMSFIYQKISTRLDKRASKASVQSLNVSRRYRKTSSSEMQRVVSWCWKFREMLNIPDKILQEPLARPFEDFIRIPQLYDKPAKVVEKDYYTQWNRASHELPKRFTKRALNPAKYNTAMSERELLLRVLLAKGEMKFVRNTLEVEERYTRALRTELSKLIQYDQQKQNATQHTQRKVPPQLPHAQTRPLPTPPRPVA